jgi:anti-anti-sigma factor
VLRCCGDEDIATQGCRRAALSRALAARTDVVVDLRELTFIDSTGIRLLLEWATAAARRGHAFRLIPGSDRVHLALRLTGVLEALGLEPRGRAA